jgi:hypothetical protein
LLCDEVKVVEDVDVNTGYFGLSTSYSPRNKSDNMPEA